jgi:hypothetical protein
MNLKNIVIAVIGLIIVVVGFILFRKKPTTTAGTNSNTSVGSQPGSGTTPATPPVTPAVDPIESAIATLSENQKMDANILASKIFNDMKGWSAHDMTLYKKLFDYGTAQFVYFVVRAWPIYSSKTLQSTMLSQNWSVLSTESNRAGYDRVRAEELVQKIIYRINNTQL